MSQPPAADAALLAEAAAKSWVMWLRPAGQPRAWPAWHVWHDGAVLVISGSGEQQLPQLRGPVEVLVRSKQTQARLITIAMTAVELMPDDEQWPAAAAALAARRLNSSLAPADLPDQWREAATITRLRADGAALEGPGRYGDESGAAPATPTTATTRSTWRPWHLGGRKRRGRG